MPKTSVILGPVLLRDFEVPERIGFGGRQAMAVHRLPGGARVIDAMGRDEADIAFSGIFSGPDATRRARTLDAMRAAGQAHGLTWDVFSYTVVVRDFRADYQATNWIPFRVACTVLRDETAAAFDAPLALMESILGDIALGTVAGIDLAAAGRALAQQDATRRGAPSHALATGLLGQAAAGIATAMATADAALPGEEIADADALRRAGGTMERLADLARARAYLGRAAVNLANAAM